MQLFQNKKKGGFTLVEMLIVIVIIGILASALIPRLNSARGRANDTARKAALQQVSAVMVSYSIDHGVFPGDLDKAYSLSGLSTELNEAGISSIPTDPVADRVFIAIKDSNTTACPDKTTTKTKDGQFGYVTIKKNGISKGGFVLIAGSETIGGANSVYSNLTSCLEADTTYDSVEICNDITTPSTPATAYNGGACTTQTNEDDLRYIYIY